MGAVEARIVSDTVTTATTPGRTAKDLLAQVPEQVNWLVPGVLAPGWTTKLAGREKLGKGTHAYYLIGCLERGERTVYGPAAVGKAKTLILTEEPEESVREKVELFKLSDAYIIFGYELAGRTW